MADGLAAFYPGWDEYQHLLVDAISPLTPAELALRVAPDLNPVWLLAAHIASCRVGWFQQLMGEGDVALGQIYSWDEDDAQPRTAAELAGALRETWGMISDCLARWTPAMLDDPFERHRPGRPTRTRTRGWVIWHVLEHDIHHGGELSLTLGAHGLRGLDL
ncbi:MAG TPA: DinB family protein [Tepidiformaceae bacterium]|nr:DinB family protein [Tepidiformaceae bacterium]